MKIHILCNDGSPLDKVWTDIFDGGVGGAEMALLSLSEQFVKDGHEVIIYNRKGNGTIEQQGIVFKHLNLYSGGSESEVTIVFRSPNNRIDRAKTGRRLWWSTDQFTIGNFGQFANKVQFVVTISPFHTKYHMRTYKIPGDKVAHIDLGVRAEYDLNEIEKQKNLCIFCSVPSRGLNILYAAWPLIKRDVPDAQLVITSDYRLWGEPAPGNHYYRLMWADADDVDFLGKVSRHELVRLQLASELLVYPCTYDELFCISVAECEVAGAYPITSAFGALPTTNHWGTVISGDPTHPQFVTEFVARAVSLMTEERSFLEERQETMANQAEKRFSWVRIAKRWYDLIEDGTIESEI